MVRGPEPQRPLSDSRSPQWSSRLDPVGLMGLYGELGWAVFSAPSAVWGSGSSSGEWVLRGPGRATTGRAFRGCHLNDHRWLSGDSACRGFEIKCNMRHPHDHGSPPALRPGDGEQLASSIPRLRIIPPPRRGFFRCRLATRNHFDVDTTPPWHLPAGSAGSTRRCLWAKRREARTMCARMRRRRAETTRIPTRPMRGRRPRIDQSVPSPLRRWRSLALACQRHRPQRHSVTASHCLKS